MVDFKKIIAEDSAFEKIIELLPEWDIPGLKERIMINDIRWADDLLFKRIVLAAYDAGKRSG